VRRASSLRTILGAVIAAAGLSSRSAYAAGDGVVTEVTIRGETAAGYATRASAETAPREPVDAASLLAELPSVHIRRLGGPGAFAALSIRGSAGAQVGVVLAGVPLTSAADPSVDIGAFPLWPGASFRVYRGFAPASLGPTGYLGGVLAVDPPSTTLGERTAWWASVGSFGSRQLRVGDLRKVGSLRFGTGLFASRTDDDFTYELRDPRSAAPVPRTRANAGHAGLGGIERVTLERPWGSASALLLAEARASGVPGAAVSPVSFARLATSRLVASTDATVHAGEARAVHVLAWGRRETSDLADPRGELDVTHATTTRSRVEAAGASIELRGVALPIRGAPALVFAVVLDGRAERFVADGGAGSRLSTPAGRIAGGLGAEATLRPTSKVTINASARLDGRRDSATNILGPFDAPVDAPPASTDLLPSGHLGASYRADAAAVISTHVGVLGRPPSFQELYGNGATLVSNAALRPERALSGDLGLHGDLGDGRVSFSYEIVGFASAARDLITWERASYAAFRAINVDRALFGGLEISARLRARAVESQLSYTLLLTQNQSDDPLQRGRPLPSRPQHDLAYDVSYRLGAARLRYGLDAIAGTTLDTSATVVLPARVLHGVGASIDVPFVRGLRAGVDVENLFDLRTLFIPSTLYGAVAAPVSDFYGFPLPGRSAFFTLRFSRDH
jgi:vitamin B12 transporter